MVQFIAGAFTLFKLYSFPFYQSSLYLSFTICWGFLPRTPGFSLDILWKRLLSHLRFHYHYLQETQARPDININSTDRMLCCPCAVKDNRTLCLALKLMFHHFCAVFQGCIAHVTKPGNTTDSSGLRSACAVPTRSIIVAFLFWWFVRQTRGNQHSEPLVFGCSSTNWLSGLLCCRRDEIIPTQGSPTGTNAHKQSTQKFTLCTCPLMTPDAQIETQYSVIKRPTHPHIASCPFLLTFNASLFSCNSSHNCSGNDEDLEASLRPHK